MCDLLWSDPEDRYGWGISPRGAGYIFGHDISEQFNHTNKLTMIARAHQLVMNVINNIIIKYRAIIGVIIDKYVQYFQHRIIAIGNITYYINRCGNIASICNFDSNLNKTYSIFKEAAESANSLNPVSIVPYFL